MKVKDTNFYKLNHEEVNKRFTGGLTYCNTFCVNNEYSPVAIYKCKNPNKKLGHKKYVLFQITEYGGLVRGMTAQEMKKERFQDAIICPDCKILLYSIYRHNYHSCGCPNESTIDGGKDYTKVGYNLHRPKIVKFDLITNKVVKK